MPLINELSPQQYLDEIKNNTISPIFKIEFLNPDESVRDEIIDSFINEGGNLNISFQNTGVRRTCTINLENINGQFLPSEDTIWMNDKFRLYLGLVIDGENYWQPSGVFTYKNPSSNRGDSDKSLVLNAIDKFSLLDGSVSGTIGETYYIPIGSNIHDAIRTLLLFDKGNGTPIDPIAPNLDSEFESDTTTYDIYVEQGGTYKDVIDKLVDIISCYAYYDENGVFTTEGGIRDLDDTNKGSLFDFTIDDREFLSQKIDYRFEDVINRYIIVGMNINGAIVTAESKNENPFSSTRISRIGTITRIENVDTIDTTLKAQDLADLRLKELSSLNVSYAITSSYMVQLDVNKVITSTDAYYGYDRERFLVQSINIPLTTSSTISIMSTNVNELPFFEGSG